MHLHQLNQNEQNNFLVSIPQLPHLVSWHEVTLFVIIKFMFFVTVSLVINRSSQNCGNSASTWCQCQSARPKGMVTNIRRCSIRPRRYCKITSTKWCRCNYCIYRNKPFQFIASIITNGTFFSQINLKDDLGMSPLHAAADFCKFVRINDIIDCEWKSGFFVGLEKIMSKLIRLGPNVAVNPFNGRTPIHIAIDSSWARFFLIFLQNFFFTNILIICFLRVSSWKSSHSSYSKRCQHKFYRCVTQNAFALLSSIWCVNLIDIWINFYVIFAFETFKDMKKLPKYWSKMGRVFMKEI